MLPEKNVCGNNIILHNYFIIAQIWPKAKIFNFTTKEIK